MYQSIWELPTIVLNSLNEEDAAKWMTAYNECNPQNNDEARKAKRKAWHSVAKAPSSFSFEIIASTDTIDRAKDIIDLDSTKKHMDSFIDYGGNIQNDHHNYTVGTIWDWKPCKVKDDRGDEVDGIIAYGNLFGGDLVYDNIRKSFVNGMNKLSIAGEAAPGKYQCDERGCYTRRNVQQLLEISLCVEPMNKYCTLVDFNKDATFTKSTSAINFQIQEYTVHKDQSICPIMSLKKSLASIGYQDVHAKEDGVHIPMSREEFEQTLPIMHRNGLVARYYKGEAIIHRRDDFLEHAFKRSIASGFCTPDGALLATIPQHVFSEYLEYGVIDKDAFGGYGFVKANKAEKMFGQQATDVMNANRQANIQEQMEIPGMDNDRPYEWISSGILGGGQRSGYIDPDKMQAGSRNYRSGKPGFFYQNQLGMPANTLYASHTNSRGGSHWLESWKTVNHLDLSDKDVGRMANGVSFDLDESVPQLKINSVSDWENTVGKYPLKHTVIDDDYEESEPGYKTNWVVPDWDTISKEYGSVYFTPSFVSEWSGRSGKGLTDEHGDTARRSIDLNGEKYRMANLDIEGPDHLFVFSPKAIKRQKAYDYNQSARASKRDYAQAAKGVSSQQQALKDKATATTGVKRSLDDFGLEVKEGVKKEQPVKPYTPKKILQAGIGTQPGEPAMMTKYEDTAEGQRELQAGLDEEKKKFDMNFTKYSNKFYAQDIYNDIRNRPHFKSLKEEYDWYKGINSRFSVEAKIAYEKLKNKR